MEPNISILELIESNASKVLIAASVNDQSLLNMYHLALDVTVLTALAQGVSQDLVAKAIDKGGNKAVFKILKERG